MILARVLDHQNQLAKKTIGEGEEAGRQSISTARCFFKTTF